MRAVGEMLVISEFTTRTRRQLHFFLFFQGAKRETTEILAAFRSLATDEQKARLAAGVCTYCLTMDDDDDDDGKTSVAGAACDYRYLRQ